MILADSIFLNINLPNPTTWFYFSGLLAVAPFFKFSRLLSVRNWDVLTLFLLMPGLLLLIEAGSQENGKTNSDEPKNGPTVSNPEAKAEVKPDERSQRHRQVPLALFLVAGGLRLFLPPLLARPGAGTPASTQS